MTESRKLDVLVVGGGILGLAIAALAAKHRFQVLLLRLRDHERPRADTLRNQSWLQSGLMYIERFSSDRQRGLWLAKRMFFSGRAMLNDLGLPLPGDSDTGVIRVKSVEEGARLVEDARLLKIANRVYRIDNREAEQRLSVGGFVLDNDLDVADRVTERAGQRVQRRLDGLVERIGGRFHPVMLPDRMTGLA